MRRTAPSHEFFLAFAHLPAGHVPGTPPSGNKRPAFAAHRNCDSPVCNFYGVFIATYHHPAAPGSIFPSIRPEKPQ